jgi:hypothetical protein
MKDVRTHFVACGGPAPSSPSPHMAINQADLKHVVPVSSYCQDWHGDMTTTDMFRRSSFPLFLFR